MKGMSTMIKIRIKNADHEIDIRFPISESELFAKLGEIHAIEGKDAPESAFVTEVYWPEEFSMLKDRFANLDELNYLARRMESFDYALRHIEIKQINPGCRMSSILSTWQSRCRMRKQRLSHCSMM